MAGNRPTRPAVLDKTRVSLEPKGINHENLARQLLMVVMVMSWWEAANLLAVREYRDLFLSETCTYALAQHCEDVSFMELRVEP